VSDIAKGILAGGWSLVAGWILPVAINILVFSLFVLPSLGSIRLASQLTHADVTERSLAGLAAAAVIGLMLSALQSPLYRILEGYLFWPARLAKARRDHHVQAKALLHDRLDVIRLEALDAQGQIETPDDKRLQDLRARRAVARYTQRDLARPAVQRSFLREHLHRYPVDDNQIAPTKLGNAVRRFEEYGYDRYRLDSQALWYELTAAAPTQLRRQVDNARAGVDFFVCLMYGNLTLAAVALISLAAPTSHARTLLVTAGVLVLLAPIWYKLAWVSTDDWALATRALVDLGRRPLAEGLGLSLPGELDGEREMWRTYCRMVRQPYDVTHSSDLDHFRRK
jgi:hypothetical protein